MKALYRTFGCEVYDTSQPFAAKITPGVPDLLVFCVRKGAFWFHEVKAPHGRPSPAQEGFRLNCDVTGVVCLLGGFEVAVAHLQKLGLVSPLYKVATVGTKEVRQSWR